MYSWNLIVLVLACDLLLLFFRFLSLPGAGCCPCTCSGRDDEGIGGGTGGGGEATELIGDRLDVDEPRGEGSNVRVTIPAFAAAVSIMSYAGLWVSATVGGGGGRGGGGGGGEHELPAPPEL